MSEAPDLTPKAPEMLWSPTVGLLVKERGWWIRIILPNGVRPVAPSTVYDLPDDAQTMWAASEPWLVAAQAKRGK